MVARGSELSAVSALRVLCNGECLFVCNCGVSIDLILGLYTKPDLSTEGSGSPVIIVVNQCKYYFTGKTVHANFHNIASVTCLWTINELHFFTFAKLWIQSTWTSFLAIQTTKDSETWLCLYLLPNIPMHLSHTVSYGSSPSATSALQAAALTGLKSPFAKYLNWGTAALVCMGSKMEVYVMKVLNIFNYMVYRSQHLSC